MHRKDNKTIIEFGIYKIYVLKYIENKYEERPT